jgi:bacterioferritin-associated ferredoxin
VVLCHCEVVSDRAVQAAIAAGAGDLDAIADRCEGAGARCGGCVPALEELLADAASAITAPSLLRARQRARRIAEPHPAGCGHAPVAALSATG